MKIRNAIVDDKHSIRDPLVNNSVADVRIWLNTLKYTRVPELFRSTTYLKGHVEQIQQELNRVQPDRLRGKTQQVVMEACSATKTLRTSIKKAMEEAKKNGLSLPHEYKLNFCLLNDVMII